MLKALVRWLWPPEASRTQPPPSPDFITRAQLDEAMKVFQQQTEWMMDEWYEKFSTLHARAEKRVNRDRQNNGKSAVQVEQPPERPSVLLFRKPWSV